jgi:hypothetical protein
MTDDSDDDNIGFAPYQRTVRDLEITLTSEHGDHLKEDTPPGDQLILEIAKSGERTREIFDDLHADQIAELRDALQDIERIFRELEKHQTHAWECTSCGQTLITKGRPETCDCGKEDWERDQDIDELSGDATTVLQHLYVLDPGETVREESLTARLEAEMDEDRPMIEDALNELIDTDILEQTDDGLQRY